MATDGDRLTGTVTSIDGNRLTGTVTGERLTGTVTGEGSLWGTIQSLDNGVEEPAHKLKGPLFG